jgi:replicative DNA helicase
VVMFIHREDLLYSVDEWNRQHDLEEEPYPRGLADVLVAKHRNGPLGQIKLRFLSNLVKFDNLASEPVASS